MEGWRRGGAVAALDLRGQPGRAGISSQASRGMVSLDGAAVLGRSAKRRHGCDTVAKPCRDEAGCDTGLMRCHGCAGAAGQLLTSGPEGSGPESSAGPVRGVHRLMRARRSTDGSIRATLVSALDLELADPRHMSMVAFMPAVSESSSIITDEQVNTGIVAITPQTMARRHNVQNSGRPPDPVRVQVRTVASVLPPRHRFAQWSLQYSSAKHGISLQTLYRRAQPGPCLLLIRDAAGYIFGCFTPMPWRPSPRYYGTGETSVFQLQVRGLNLERAPVRRLRCLGVPQLQQLD